MQAAVVRAQIQFCSFFPKHVVLQGSFTLESKMNKNQHGRPSELQTNRRSRSAESNVPLRLVLLVLKTRDGFAGWVLSVSFSLPHVSHALRTIQCVHG